MVRRQFQKIIQFVTIHRISRLQVTKCCQTWQALPVGTNHAVRVLKQTLVGLQGVSSRIWTSARLGEDLRKLMFFQRPRFFKTRSKARRQFEFAQRFPTSTLGQKSNLVWGKKSPVTHRKNFSEFLDFPNIAQ